jgi:hypothetical protein
MLHMGPVAAPPAVYLPCRPDGFPMASMSRRGPRCSYHVPSCHLDAALLMYQPRHAPLSLFPSSPTTPPTISRHLVSRWGEASVAIVIPFPDLFMMGGICWADVVVSMTVRHETGWRCTVL